MNKLGQQWRAQTAQRRAVAAAEIMRAGGYEPLEPYPGHSHNLWRVLCVRCHAEVRVPLYSARNRRPDEISRCRHNNNSVVQPSVRRRRSDG